ncbi:hypothetical protein SODALDRAFT_319980 [Sodiomyces alkalinus F11]|uniref:Uncharacterized protein n=1 Tax=Sodiomyces alkalinus (strain CBS 110278 / VKM F-3762 / F11) TaxID=1314773 RepID=A0A3N2Q9V7_SODAK|nr:hypothetical protein SODALDRAFT_319980 [Sodiomyces alkalinus F11]ROT43554.1 hypothetical protein SODALDRAFT_319980 [Sodiomyces alkalinus F11]
MTGIETIERPSSDDQNHPARAPNSRTLDPPQAPSASNTKSSTKSSLDNNTMKFNEGLRPAVSLLTARVALKRKKDVVDQEMGRLKREREKTESKFLDFPSVRDMHNRQAEELQQRAQDIKKELDLNSDRLNSNMQSFASTLQQFCSNAASKALKSGHTSAHDTSVTLKLEALVNPTDEIRFLKQENETLKSRVNEDFSTIQQTVDALTEGHSELDKNIKDLRAETRNIQMGGSKYSGADAHMQTEQLTRLAGRVEYIETSLTELDPDFVQAACHDFTLKLPQVQQELDTLRAEMETNLTSVDQASEAQERIMADVNSLRSEMVTRGQLREATERFQSSQRNIASTIGRKMNEMQEHINKMKERLHPLESDGGLHKTEPGKPTTCEGGSAPDGSKPDASWNSEEARIQALEAARAARAAQQRHGTPTPTPPPAPTSKPALIVSTSSPSISTASELAAVREEIRSLQEQRKAQDETYISQARMAKVTASTEEAIQKLSARIQAVEEAQKAAECSNREEQEKHNLLGKVEWLGRRMQENDVARSTYEHTQASMRQALNTLEGKYSNLTTEDLMKQIMDHTQPHRPVVKMLEALQARVSVLERTLKDINSQNAEHTAKKRKIDALDSLEGEK